MKIRSVSIIGLGLIGGSIAKALRKSKADIRISAFDKPSVLNLAIEDKVIDSALTTIDDAVKSDVVFICLPVDLSLKVFAQLIPNLNDNSVITDVCGVKGIFEEIWSKSSSRGIYIGGHPMTGKEKGGYQNSDPLLFENSIYILTECNSEKLINTGFNELIGLLGARIACIDAHFHDRVVANVSHLPQLLSVSLVNSSSKSEGKVNYTDFAAGGFRDMTRIASSDFEIWESVIKFNKEEILTSLNHLVSEITEMKNFVSAENFAALSRKFEEARVKRDEIPLNTKGFMSPLHDIFVFVKDEPGVISKMSTALADQNINIKDIELLKIREGTGGTFRLSFESSNDAEKAQQYLRKAGYTTEKSI